MKRYIKPIISIFMASNIILSGFNVFGANNDVEIKFNLGSSDLYINSQIVSVPAPFSAGQGTTMVPLRVISEAFGASVDWDANEKKITINYDNSEISMYIGSKDAVVNGDTVFMTEAPVIKEGTTMIPLRFVSEKFGASVSYDEATKQVTVLKSASNQSENKEESIDVNELLNVSEKDYIGDSSLGWYMKNSPSFSLTDRNFDGSSLTYTDDKNLNEIAIYIDKDISEDFTIDEAIADEKRYLGSKTLISQKQSKEDGADCYELSYKTKDETVYTKLYLKNGILYDFNAYIDNTAEKQDIDVALDVFNSIKLGFPKNASVSDISSISETGSRKFEQTKLKISMSLPKDWTQYNENSNSINEFYFRDKLNDDNIPAIIKISMFSSEEGVSLKQWRDRNADLIRANYNPTFMTIKNTSGTISSHPYEGYEYTVKNDDKPNTITRAFYISGEDYKYQIESVMTEDDYKNADKFNEVMNAINSFNFEKPDKNEVGILSENYEDYKEADKKTKTVTDKESGVSAQIPVSWISLGDSYLNEEGTIIFSLYSQKGNDIDLKDLADDMVMVRSNETFKIMVKKSKSEKIAGKTASYLKTSAKTDAGTLITEDYMFTNNNRVIHVIVTYSEKCNGTRTKNLIDNIFKSVKVD